MAALTDYGGTGFSSLASNPTDTPSPSSSSNTNTNNNNGTISPPVFDETTETDSALPSLNGQQINNNETSIPPPVFNETGGDIIVPPSVLDNQGEANDAEGINTNDNSVLPPDTEVLLPSIPVFNETDGALPPLNGQQMNNNGNSIPPSVFDETVGDGREESNSGTSLLDGSETPPPHIFNEGTFSPGYLEDFALPPDAIKEEDRPWFLEGGTLAPQFYRDNTLPPWLMESGTLAPGLWKDGDIDVGYIQEDWSKDLLPELDSFSLDSHLVADPVFRWFPLVEYQRSSFTSSMAAVPRFGYGNDVTALGLYLSDQQEGSSEATEYLVGLSILSGIMLAVFLLWGLVLCFAKFARPKTVLGGHSFVQEAPSSDSTSSKPNRQKGFWPRIVFSIAGVLVVAFALLFALMGTQKLQNATKSIDEVAVSLRELLTEATDVSIRLGYIRDQSSTLHDRIESQYENPCPGFEAFDTSDLGKEMNDAIGSTIEKLGELKTDLDEGMENLERGIRDAESAVDSCDAVVDDVRDYKLIGQLVALPWILLTGMLMAGVSAACWNAVSNKFGCFLSWFVLPLFIILTVFSIVLTNVMLVSASANADFCGGQSSTPDQNVLDFLVKSDVFSPDDYLYKAAEFYTFQCTDRAREDILLKLRNYEGDIARADGVLKYFVYGMTDASIEKLSFGCQKDFVPLINSMELVQGMMESAREVTAAVFDMMECERLATVYTNTVYEGTCTHTIEGFTWAFSSLLVVSFMGMIMITLRSSFQNNTEFLKNEGDDENDVVAETQKVVLEGGSTMSGSLEDGGSATNDEIANGTVGDRENLNGGDVDGDAEAGARTKAVAGQEDDVDQTSAIADSACSPKTNQEDLARREVSADNNISTLWMDYSNISC